MKEPIHWARYSGLGIQMVVIMLFCWWLGKKIENNFEFINDPIGQLLGIFFGIFAVMYNLIKSVK
mgnify:CR=1 FL=1